MDGGVLLALSLAGLPLWAGLVAASRIAIRHEMPLASRLWRLAGDAALLAMTALMLAGVAMLLGE